MIEIKIKDLKGVPAPRPRVTRKGTFNDPKYTAYKDLLRLKARGFWKYIDVPIMVDLEFGFKKAKSAKYNKYSMPVRDVDNLAKGVLDAFNGVLYEDDALVTELRVKKYYADEDFVLIRIWEKK